MDRSCWRVMTKHGPLEKGMANYFTIVALRTSWTVWKSKKIRHWKMNSPGQKVPNMLLEISGEITPERMKGWGKAKTHPFVDGAGDKSKVQCCKEQYCIGTWNVKSMNQGKLEVVKQELARVKINILGISKLKWTGMGEFNSDDCYYLLLWARIPYKKWSSHHSQQKSPKCSTWMQSQKQQNDLCLFPSQTIQCHSSLRLCPDQ